MSELNNGLLINELQKKLRKITEHIEKEQLQSEEERKQEIMKLLHEFNKVKDATQVILGTLANIDGVTFKEMHLKYNLPID